MSRRPCLLAAAAILANSGLCGTPLAEATRNLQLEGKEAIEVWDFNVELNVVCLKNSVSQDWVDDFKQALGKYGALTIQYKGQLHDIYTALGQSGKGRQVSQADAVTLGDSWLAPAVKAGYLQPIKDAKSCRWWKALAPHWQQLVTRNESGLVDPKGQVWAVPYRWGCTMVAFRPDSLCRRGGHEIKDWSDLLQPRLRGRLAFLDSPREFVGVALKTLGLPYNCTYAQLKASHITLQQLKQRLRQLYDQVRLFSSRDLNKALSADDVWAVVGSSGDLIPLVSRSYGISLVVPVSGTALWADLWTVPAKAMGGSNLAGPSPLLPAMFEYGLMPSRVISNRGLRSGASPLQLPNLAALSHAKQQLPDVLEGSHAMDVNEMPAHSILRRSEFLFPIDEDTASMYKDLLAL